MIVDDDKEFLTALTEAMRESNIETEQAANVTELELLLTNSTPDLLVLDYYLNGETGAEVAEDLMKRGEFGGEIVLMSGDSRVGVTVRAGGWKFLEKPFTVKDLLRIGGL